MTQPAHPLRFRRWFGQFGLILLKERESRAMPPRRVLKTCVLYTWTAPTSCVGLLVGVLTLSSGGRVRIRRGTLEFHGGFSTWFANVIGFGAMTLGHVILGRDDWSLDVCRDHEQAHVRQAQLRGPMFIPAYLLASAWAHSRGQHYYIDNWFERDARRACGEE